MKIWSKNSFSSQVCDIIYSHLSNRQQQYYVVQYWKSSYVPQGCTLLLLNIIDLADNVICLITILLVILLSNVRTIRLLICSINRSSLLSLNLTFKTLWKVVTSGLLILLLRKPNLSHLDHSNNSGITDEDMDWITSGENNLLTCSDYLFSRKLDRGSCSQMLYLINCRTYWICLLLLLNP